MGCARSRNGLSHYMGHPPSFRVDSVPASFGNAHHSSDKQQGKGLCADLRFIDRYGSRLYPRSSIGGFSTTSMKSWHERHDSILGSDL
jgi:hypothetical protein